MEEFIAEMTLVINRRDDDPGLKEQKAVATEVEKECGICRALSTVWALGRPKWIKGKGR